MIRSKHIALNAGLLAVAVFAVHFLAAQKSFEGRINYRVEYLDLPDGAEGVDQSLPQFMTAYVKGKNLRVEQKTALAGKMIWVQSNKLDTVYQSFNFLDRRVLVAKPIKKEPARFRVVERDQEQELFGMDLTKYHLQGADGNHFEVWANDRYHNPFQYELPEMKYLPLIFEQVRHGIRMKLTAVKLVEEPMDETYFAYPQDAERITERILLNLLK